MYKIIKHKQQSTSPVRDMFRDKKMQRAGAAVFMSRLHKSRLEKNVFKNFKMQGFVVIWQTFTVKCCGCLYANYRRGRGEEGGGLPACGKTREPMFERKSCFMFRY